MATFKVRGYALGPVFCEYEVEASNAEAAKKEAARLFDNGARPDFEFENDPGAFCDFDPMDCIAQPTPTTPTGGA